MPLRDRPLGFAGHDVRLAMVDAISQAGVPVIVFNPVVFMGNLLRGWAYPRIAQQDRFEYPHATDLEVSWVCQEDLASLMVAAVDRSDLGGRRFAVGGPETLRGADVAQALSRVLGRRIEFVPQDIDDFCAAIRPQLRIADAALREHMLTELARIYRWYNESPERPFKVDMRATLAELPVTFDAIRGLGCRAELAALNHGYPVRGSRAGAEQIGRRGTRLRDMLGERLRRLEAGGDDFRAHVVLRERRPERSPFQRTCQSFMT